MTAYIIIYLLSPGINSQIESLSNKRLLGLIAILYFVTFSGIINKGSQIGGGDVIIVSVFVGSMDADLFAGILA